MASRALLEMGFAASVRSMGGYRTRSGTLLPLLAQDLPGELQVVYGLVFACRPPVLHACVCTALHASDRAWFPFLARISSLHSAEHAATWRRPYVLRLVLTSRSHHARHALIHL